MVQPSLSAVLGTFEHLEVRLEEIVFGHIVPFARFSRGNSLSQEGVLLGSPTDLAGGLDKVEVLEVEEPNVPSEEDGREKAPRVLILSKNRSYDGAALQFEEVGVEEDEPDEEFLFIIAPYFGVD